MYQVDFKRKNFGNFIEQKLNKTAGNTNIYSISHALIDLLPLY